MRGKGGHSDKGQGCCRITPAYAGKRVSIPLYRRSRKDHPRLCGEKLSGKFVIICLTGSPPPMRGKEYNDTLFDACYRITPAYAGKRLDRSPAHSQTRDHPRLCGEKPVTTSQTILILGSPPPMRGKEKRRIRIHRCVRITPAYAGKSLRSFLHSDT